MDPHRIGDTWVAMWTTIWTDVQVAGYHTCFVRSTPSPVGAAGPHRRPLLDATVEELRDFGYDEISATDVLNYVASIFARGDTKGE